MIPSRGLARAKPGLVAHNQIFSRAPVRSIPREATSRSSLSSSRQFGTSILSKGSTIPRASTTGFLSGSRIGAASILSSQSLLVSNRRFASTDSTTPTTTPSSEFSPESDFSSFTDFDAPSILNIPEGVGYLAKLGLDYGHGPTSVCQWVVEQLHFNMGFGWLGAIVGASLAIRVVMAYPALIAQLESHKSQEMRKDPVYQDRQQKFMMAMARPGGDTAELMQLRMQIQYLQKQHNVKMSRMFWPMLQIPFAYGMFKLTRGMAMLPVPGLENAGALWFPDLTVADPLYILPCVGAFTMYLSIKRSLPFMASEQATLMKFAPFILGPIGFFVTISFPAAVQVYFASAAVLQYFQTALWHIPIVRKLCGLPPLESTIINPAYQKPASPFANRQGTYQAPRTVDTTATEQKPQEKKEAVKSPLAMFRDAKKQVSQTMSKYKKDAAQAQREAERKYAEEKAQEEKNQYLARKAEAERKQAQKRAGKK
ncbi:hypothetical protein N0V93_006376 [Gnomoniopsis smithogilvyi]|uniref:Membrane insertase YidC/Oxa/ALB C-terminal domain-containing protein n=1 Tax=Gnomoniopsis smithogilvyi TaxID=1191159 RepID=A0A9W8YPQ3_9PEZI|nr:hypothetical protein N0V93_006376 [Gnomoniopsis smithogilvyi]